MPAVVCSGQATIASVNDTTSLNLTNEAVVVAAAPDGTVASLSGVATTASVLLGGVDDSANWALTAGTPSGMTGTLSGKTYTVTALSADTAYVDLTASRTGYSSLTKRFSVSKSKQGVQGVAGENFVINYATSELWTADASNAPALGKYGGDFTVNGDGSQRVWAIDPFGRPALTWRTVNNDTTSDGDGGWDKLITGLDPEKSYMSVVYARRLSTSTNGKFYHGCGKSGSTVTVNGAASSNPYFANGIDINSFDTLDWYVSIGFIKANADGSASSAKGGLYKLSTGAQVVTYPDFRMAANATTQSHRTYMFYSTDPNASLEWWGPGFFEINGNEPKLRDLVGNPEWYNGNIAIGSDGTLSGGGGGKVTIGGLGYTGALDANRTSVDANGALQGVASGAGTVVSNAQIGINASGELYGTGTALTKVSNNQIYVDSAGAIQGVSTSSNGLSVANNTDNVIRAPGGGVYTTKNPTMTGRLKIALPQSWTNTMMRFTVEIYEYAAGYMCTLEIGGYNYLPPSSWVHVTARVIGGSNVEYPVYFGHDGTKCCIWIGAATNETWSYPQVRIRDFFAGYSNTARSQWESGWGISFDQTAIAFGTGANQYSASVTDTLPGANWAKISGANRPADNATVGATWGSNLSSVPSNISTAGSTPTVDLRNNQIGLNASGQLYGAGAGNGTTVSNAQISVDTATGVIGGIGTGAGTAVANSQVAFSARQTWEFRGSAEGWVAANSSLATSTDTLTLTATAGNPQLGLTGLSIPGATYDKVRVRLRRVSGSGWRGVLFYGTAAHNYSESYKKVLLDPVASTSFVVIEFDMADLTAGGTDWKSNTITSMRLDLGNVAGDAFEIDWISVGKYGHDVDLVLSASSQIIAGTSTNGVVLDAASKSLQVMTGGNERVRLGNQPTAVNGTAYGMVVKDTSGNVVFDSRNNVGIVGHQTYDNYNVGDSTTNPDWDTNANGTGNVALGANALRADGLAKASTRSNNVALGSGALRYTTTGGNIAVGASALRGAVSGNTGYDNIAIGYNAMVNAVLPTYNIAIGRSVLSNVSAGSENVAIGYNAMRAGTNANYSVAVGHQALKAAQGNQNTAVGYKAGISQTSPSNNTLVGYQAGTYITTGGGNTYIGTEAGNTQAATAKNMVVITSGFGDALVIDSSALAKIYGNKIWHEGNDGANSGLDADLLDGQHGSYYLSWANLTGKPTTLAGYGITDAATSAHTHSDATTSAAGFMSTADKTKLDGVATNANNYSLPAATDTVLGGVKLASSAAQTVAANAVTTTASRTYGIQVNASGQLVVNVPWVDTDTNTVYTHPTSDGSLHVPATGTTNAGKVLTAGSTAGSLSWQTVSATDSTKLPLSGGTMTGAISFAATQTWPTFNQNTSGSAASLATARTFTIGSTDKTFNGSANVSWTLTEIGAAAATHSHTIPAVGDWFNGGYMSIRSDGVMQAGKYLDWHNAGTDTGYVGRTWTDANGNLTHSAGLKVKGTGGLGYAFGGAVTQLTSRDTGVTLDTPSGTITLFSTTVTAGTMNKFTLTNSCITALDVVVVGVRASNSGTFNVFVNRTNAGVCDIVVQNLVTVATAQAVHINFAVIKGANA